jgi:putative spermidine/putrescine transport system permease protein
MPFLSTRLSAVLLLPAMALLGVCLAIPLFYLLNFSTLTGDFAVQDLQGPTLSNFSDLLTDVFFLGVAGKTFLISLGVTAAALVLGFPLAALMWRAPAVWRSPISIIVLSPLLVSMVASSYGWIVILGQNGVINNALIGLGLIQSPIKLLYTDLAIGIGLVHVVLPFMVLNLVAALDRIDMAVSEAAASLGANRARIWWHVLLPLCVPGIGAGVTLCFSLSISAYVTPAVLGPSGPNFITTLIYQNFVSLYEWGAGSAMAFLLLIVAASAVFGLGALTNLLAPARRRT